MAGPPGSSPLTAVADRSIKRENPRTLKAPASRAREGWDTAVSRTRLWPQWLPIAAEVRPGSQPM